MNNARSMTFALSLAALSALLSFSSPPVLATPKPSAAPKPSTRPRRLHPRVVYTLPQYQLRDLGPGSGTGAFYSPIPAPAISSSDAVAWNEYDANFLLHVHAAGPGFGPADITAGSPFGTGVLSGINRAGQVAGEWRGGPQSYPRDGAADAFLWTPGNSGTHGTAIDLGTLGGGPNTFSVATALNDQGQVVGTAKDAQIGFHAFLWTPGGTNGVASNPQMQDLSLLNPAFTCAIAINDAEEVVSGGVGFDRFNQLATSPALLYADGQVITLPLLQPGDPYATPVAPLGINASGQVFGQGYVNSEFTGFLWTPDAPNGTVGHIISLPLSPNVDGRLTTTALNNAGQIAGYGDLQADVYQGTHGFLWTPNPALTGGDLRDVGGLGVTDYGPNDNGPNYSYYTGYTSQCSALNDGGTVVGSASYPSNLFPHPLVSHGFVYTQGFMYDLNSLLTAGSTSGLTVVNATGISPDGTIIGLAMDAAGGTHAVLLTPKPTLGRVSRPAITALDPQSILQYSPAFTLYVTGTDFAPGSQFFWNGTALPTTSLSNELLSTAVPAAALAVSGPAAITVQNPDGSVSASATFTVTTGAEPVPSCTALSPGTITVGGGNQPVVLTGSGFFADTQVTWGGNQYTLTQISADHTQATVTLPAAVLIYPSQNDFLLSSPLSALGTLSPVLHVLPLAPTVTSVTPTQVPTGTGATLTITGTHFCLSGYSSASGTQVLVNGYSAQITALSSTQVTAFVDARALQPPGVVALVVTNGPPGGGTVNTVLTVVDTLAANVHAHLLWDNTSGQASVWNLGDPNPAATSQLYGPFTGWTAKVIAQGPDNNARILWTNTNGQAALWNLADASPSATAAIYGPFPGWTATALTVGPDNAAHLLWDNTDGRVALWNTTDADPTSTCTIAGPYSGWSGVAIGIGTDNHERLLWDNVNGMASVWNLTDASPALTCLLAGPYSGWTAKRLSVGNDNAAHLLWDNVSGQVSLWNLSDDYPAATCVVAGPYAGWSGQDLSVGVYNKGHLLWDNTGGTMSLWNLADANPLATNTVAGPYTGWTAVSVAAGR
jgi:probable HAF family extracellular repeat protein